MYWWFMRARQHCLANSLNDYDSTVTQSGTRYNMNNQFNFQGSQQIRDTDGQDRFIATNTMRQDVTVDTG